jgi:hypothetical protein
MPSLPLNSADLISACGRTINPAKAMAPACAWLKAGFFMSLIQFMEQHTNHATLTYR